jgi:hypothetical protein
VSKVQLSVSFLHLFQSIEALKLFFCQRIDHFINYFPYTSLEVEPIYASLWALRLLRLYCDGALP